MNLDCVGKQKIEMGQREFTLAGEAEPADPEHNAVPPVDVYKVFNYFTFNVFGTSRIFECLFRPLMGWTPPTSR